MAEFDARPTRTVCHHENVVKTEGLCACRETARAPDVLNGSWGQRLAPSAVTVKKKLLVAGLFARTLSSTRLRTTTLDAPG